VYEVRHNNGKNLFKIRGKDCYRGGYFLVLISPTAAVMRNNGNQDFVNKKTGIRKRAKVAKPRILNDIA